MNARHRIPDDPRIRTTQRPATAIVERLTGVRVTDTTPTRHDGSQRTGRDQPEDVR